MKIKAKYRKIPKISPMAYVFQRPFLRGLYLEGLIHGGASLYRDIYLRFTIDWSSLIVGSKCSTEKYKRYINILLLFIIIRPIFQVQAPRGLYNNWRGDVINGGFFALLVWGAYICRGFIHGGEFYEYF